jgi:RNA polymerase sigma-70 factor (ECF subfamily)
MMSELSPDEHNLAESIREGNDAAFEKMFFEYYASLCRFSKGYVGTADAARDVVQEVFIKIWSNRVNFYIHTSVKSYLFQAVRNSSLNAIQKKKRYQSFEEEYLREIETKKVPEPNNSSEELTQKIWQIADEMPEKRKVVFTLYREHGLSYKEIADILEIKRKTVENHMGRALNFIRERLEK